MYAVFLSVVLFKCICFKRRIIYNISFDPQRNPVRSRGIKKTWFSEQRLDLGHQPSSTTNLCHQPGLPASELCAFPKTPSLPTHGKIIFAQSIQDSGLWLPSPALLILYTIIIATIYWACSPTSRHFALLFI